MNDLKQGLINLAYISMSHALPHIQDENIGNMIGDFIPIIKLIYGDHHFEDDFNDQMEKLIKERTGQDVKDLFNFDIVKDISDQKLCECFLKCGVMFTAYMQKWSTPYHAKLYHVYFQNIFYQICVQYNLNSTDIINRVKQEASADLN